MMKKFYALLTIVILTLAIAGCGSNNKVQDYLDKNSTEMQEALDGMASLLGEGSSIAMRGEGDDQLFLDFKFGAILDASIDTDLLKDALTEGLDAQSSFFESMAGGLKSEIKVNQLKVTVTYLDQNDEVLASQGFDAK